VLSLPIYYWHVANVINFVTMTLQKAAVVLYRLSAAGDNKEEITYSNFADVKMLQFNSYSLVLNIIRTSSSDSCQKSS
jgi:hypothetical protein